MFPVAVILLIAIFSTSHADAEYSSAFVRVRSDASLFHWLMKTFNATHDYKSFPLVIVLAGGPGDSSTGYSNFYEVGPRDIQGRNRSETWLKYANLLFLDFPVGCGYSFVEDGGKFVTSNDMMAQDFLVWLNGFLAMNPEFKTIPSYIFGESYGGKMAVVLAKAIHQDKSLQFNLKGIGLGDAWIAPIAITQTYPTFLHSMSVIDGQQMKELDIHIIQLESLLPYFGTRATLLWQDIFAIVSEMSYGTNIHNLFDKFPDSWGALDVFMNSDQMRSLLKIPASVKWNSQAHHVFDALAHDFLMPVTNELEFLLNQTNINVAVFVGQLDGIVTTIGTEKWISELNWRHKKQFEDSKKKLILKSADSLPLVYVKECERFKFYTVLKAGHSVPMDQLQSSVKILKRMIAT